MGIALGDTCKSSHGYNMNERLDLNERNFGFLVPPFLVSNEMITDLHRRLVCYVNRSRNRTGCRKIPLNCVTVSFLWGGENSCVH